MTDKPQLADVLREYMKKTNREPQQLANLTGIPKRTIVNWLQGHVARPREWQQLAKMCSALHLSEAEATELMAAAGHPSIALLWDRARSTVDIQLLSPWTESIRKRRNGVFFQVIEDPPHFVGRQAMLKEVEDAVLSGKHMTLYSLEGMPGVGKTALAARLCYQLRDYLADGVLWANLAASDAMSILSMFAYAYGFDVSRHSDLVSRSQAVRAILANKRALIVLDNAQRSEDIEPLLPPTGTCAVIVTTRNRNLRVSRHASRFLVDVFDKVSGEAFDLFVRILGKERAEADRQNLLEIADLLGQLPLALDIAASRLAYETGWLVSDFLERVRQESRRLSELVYEDLSVRVAFNLSYDALTPELKQFFASLGVFEGDDFGIAAVAYVTGTEPGAAMDSLRVLYGLSLVRRGRENRYQLHPLLRDYAREKLVGKYALGRMVEFFVQLAEDNQTNYDTLDLERSNVIAALQKAADESMLRAVIHGVNAFYPYAETRGLYAVAREHVNQACRAARELGDTSGLATALLNLAGVEARQGNVDDAEKYAQEALALAQADANRERTAAALQSLGSVAAKRSDFGQAEKLYLEGLAIAQAVNRPVLISGLLSNLGGVAQRRGDYQKAMQYCTESLPVTRAAGSPRSLSALLINLGSIEAALGEFAEAEAHLLEALDIARGRGYREHTVHILTSLGALAQYSGDYAKASEYLQEALPVAREMGHEERITALLQNIGSVEHSLGRFSEAEAHSLEALSRARKIQHRERVSALLANLGAAAIGLGQYAKAESYLQEGLKVAKEISHQENEGAILQTLGTLAAKSGNYDDARVYLDRALSLARDIQQRWLISGTLIESGNLHLMQDRLELAAEAFEEALHIAQEVGVKEYRAGALYGLARTLAVQGSSEEAVYRGNESLAIYEAIGHYMASEVREWLRHLPRGE